MESTFAQEQDRARGLVKAASDSLRLALDDLVRSEAQLTPLEREAAKLHLRARELLVEQMIENLDAVFQRRHAELRQPLLSRIREAVHAVRIREGYHIAIDRAGEGLEMDVDASIDITVAVLTELRCARGQTSMRATPQSASANSPGFARFRPFVLPSHTSVGATNGVGSRLRSASSP